MLQHNTAVRNEIKYQCAIFRLKLREYVIHQFKVYAQLQTRHRQKIEVFLKTVFKESLKLKKKIIVMMMKIEK